MRKLLYTTALALCLGGTLAGHAEARQWWVVNFSSDTCQSVDFTPDAFERDLRSDATISGPPQIEVGRDNNGQVIGVTVTAAYKSGNSARMWFATTYQFCEYLRGELVKDGQLTRRSDLQ